ncbi:MAG: thiocillin family RiPP [Ancrocorticia sp.]
MSVQTVDLTSVELELETLADGNALGCFGTATTAGSASCPASSASTFTTASSYS